MQSVNREEFAMLNTLFKATLVALMTVSISATVGCSSTSSTSDHRTAGQTLDDGTITAKVKTALIQDPMTKARDINVDTYQGVVQLSGFVDDRTQRSRAVQVARGVNGVKEVRDNLEIKPAS
jgi:hyperosmotically inducible protein